MTEHKIAAKAKRLPWTRDRLIRERATAMSYALDPSSRASYSSALNSYADFCRLHDLDLEPTPDTLSFYVVYMCHHIQPRSVQAYLAGICSELESVYPNVRSVRTDRFVTRTLKGCHKLFSKPVQRKNPLRRFHLRNIFDSLKDSKRHDDKLFLAMMYTGFYGLMRLGEMAWSDKPKLRNTRDRSLRWSLDFSNDCYRFTLPGHKSDKQFEGSIIQINKRSNDPDCPWAIMESYITSRDKQTPSIWLWAKENGEIPTRSWYMSRLCEFITDKTISGHSLRAGGATFFAELGVPSHIIQALGRWASETFEVYIRTHPAILAGLLYPRPKPNNTQNTANSHPHQTALPSP
jgi:hypothetical protein